MPLQKAAYAAGILFAVLTAAGITAIGDPGSTPDEVTAWVKDNSLALAFMLMASGALLLQWFVAAVSRLLRRAAGAADVLPTAARVGGTAASTCLLVASALIWAPAAASDDAFEIDPFAANLVETAAYGTLVCAAMSLGVFALATCLAARAGGLLPAWLVWSGIVVALLQVVAFTFFPMALMVVWVLVLAVVLTLRPADVSAGTAAGT